MKEGVWVGLGVLQSSHLLRLESGRRDGLGPVLRKMGYNIPRKENLPSNSEISLEINMSL